ncbi:mRNA splicing protein prp28, partial [Spiromyces aspiralis]
MINSHCSSGPHDPNGESKRPMAPLSVEELKRIKESNEDKRPVFLTKQQRAQLALERRQKEVEDRRRQQEEQLREVRAAFAPREHHDQSRGMDRSPSPSRSRHRDRGRNTSVSDRRDHRSSRLDQDHRSRSRSKDRRRRGRTDNYRRQGYSRSRSRSRSPGRSGTATTSATMNSGDIMLSSQELKAIKEQYLGRSDADKRKNRRPNDKRVVFDWDDTDDTSRDYNDLYVHRHEPQMFGRGHVAGFDIKEQMARRSEYYNKLLSGRRSRDELMVSGSKKAGKGGKWDDRHWSEKQLEEMTERDWRIFREDYSISARGGKIPKPIRTWGE